VTARSIDIKDYWLVTFSSLLSYCMVDVITVDNCTCR